MVRTVGSMVRSATACAAMAIVGYADCTVASADDTRPAESSRRVAVVAFENELKAPIEGEADPLAEPAKEPSELTDDSPAPATADVAAEDVERIEERYPNRTVKIERFVVQDAIGNYVNHGKWRMFDEKGRVLGSGEYRLGKRQGLWRRWYPEGVGEMFTGEPYTHFQAPFISEATFDKGELDGSWTVYDSQGHKCCELNFVRGERDGKSTWYYPTGVKMREIDFVKGQTDGLWQEWGADQTIKLSEVYKNGSRLSKRIELYASGQPKRVSLVLNAREILTTNYDWWEASLSTTTVKEGVDLRSGLSTTWYKNGQKESEGEYANDVPVGKHVWWYENGQKMLEGRFENGERTGLWTWWHENGQKKASGEFVENGESGRWRWWKDDGKVDYSITFTEGQSQPAGPISGKQLLTMPGRSSTPGPTARRTQPPRAGSEAAPQ